MEYPGDKNPNRAAITPGHGLTPPLLMKEAYPSGIEDWKSQQDGYTWVHCIYLLLMILLQMLPF